MNVTVHIFRRVTDIALVKSVIDKRSYALDAFMEASGEYLETRMRRSDIDRVQRELEAIQSPAFALTRAETNIRGRNSYISKGDIIIKEPGPSTGGISDPAL